MLLLGKKQKFLAWIIVNDLIFDQGHFWQQNSISDIWIRFNGTSLLRKIGEDGGR